MVAGESHPPLREVLQRGLPERVPEDSRECGPGQAALYPRAHAGARYALTGPKAITFHDVAATIAAVSGKPVMYKDIDQEAWINGAITVGVPADYAVMLRWPTGTIIAGNGSQPTGDIEIVTGRRPASFEAFARRNAAAWTTLEDK